MRWGDGTHRLVRPVHWIVASTANRSSTLEIIGAHRRDALGGPPLPRPGPPVVTRARRPRTSRRSGARVLVDPAERRDALLRRRSRPRRELWEASSSGRGAARRGRRAGRVAGRGRRPVRPVVPRATARDPGHDVEASSEVVLGARATAGSCRPSSRSPIPTATPRDTCAAATSGSSSGRLEDARFFWSEDRKRPLASRSRRPETRRRSTRSSEATRTRRAGSPSSRRSLARRLELPADDASA